MYKEELRCPHCNRLVGKTITGEKSIAKVSKVAPNIKQSNIAIFESKCKCNNFVYIIQVNCG